MTSLTKTASWVIVSKQSSKAVLETFDSSLVNCINQKLYKAVPILEYLQNFNKNLKEVKA
jgi:hypothetical protein